MLRMLTSSVGRKLLMAATGLLLLGFLIVHLSGNLLIFKSAESFNHYSEALVSNPLIYIAEAGLLALFLVHLASGITVTLKNRAARPVAYEKKAWAGNASHKSLASTTMIYSGLIVLIFVPLHVWMFKFGTYYASAADPNVRDLHRLVLEEFQNPLLVVWYVVAMVVIGFHLWHGFGSAFESLGVGYRKSLRRVGQALALILATGFLLIPVIVFLMGDKL